MASIEVSTSSVSVSEVVVVGLEMAGIDETVENVGSYIFDRYEGTNEPSGTARDNGMVLIMNALHYLPPDEFAPFLETELERYSKYGVTAIQPAEGSITWLQGAALLEKEDRLDVRLFPALDWLTSQLRALDDEESLAFIEDWESYQTELIICRSVADCNGRPPSINLAI